MRFPSSVFFVLTSSSSSFYGTSGLVSHHELFSNNNLRNLVCHDAPLLFAFRGRRPVWINYDY